MSSLESLICGESAIGALGAVALTRDLVDFGDCVSPRTDGAAFFWAVRSSPALLAKGSAKRVFFLEDELHGQRDRTSFCADFVSLGRVLPAS